MTLFVPQVFHRLSVPIVSLQIIILNGYTNHTHSMNKWKSKAKEQQEKLLKHGSVIPKTNTWWQFVLVCCMCSIDSEQQIHSFWSLNESWHNTYHTYLYTQGQIHEELIVATNFIWIMLLSMFVTSFLYTKLFIVSTSCYWSAFWKLPWTKGAKMWGPTGSLAPHFTQNWTSRLIITAAFMQIWPDIQNSVCPRGTSDHVADGHKPSAPCKEKNFSLRLRNGEQGRRKSDTMSCLSQISLSFMLLLVMIKSTTAVSCSVITVLSLPASGR